MKKVNYNEVARVEEETPTRGDQSTLDPKMTSQADSGNVTPTDEETPACDEQKPYFTEPLESGSVMKITDVFSVSADFYFHNIIPWEDMPNFLVEKCSFFVEDDLETGTHEQVPTSDYSSKELPVYSTHDSMTKEAGPDNSGFEFSGDTCSSPFSEEEPVTKDPERAPTKELPRYSFCDTIMRFKDNESEVAYAEEEDTLIEPICCPPSEFRVITQRVNTVDDADNWNEEIIANNVYDTSIEPHINCNADNPVKKPRYCVLENYIDSKKILVIEGASEEAANEVDSTFKISDCWSLKSNQEETKPYDDFCEEAQTSNSNLDDSAELLGYPQPESDTNCSNVTLKTEHSTGDFEEAPSAANDDLFEEVYEIRNYNSNEKLITLHFEANSEDSASDEEALNMFPPLVTGAELIEKCEDMRREIKELDEELFGEIMPLLDQLIVDVNELISRIEKRDEDDWFLLEPDMSDIGSRTCC